MKNIIKVWKGRAYLHSRWHMGKIVCEKDTPLGDDTRLIKKIIDMYACKVIFLNDDFSESFSQ